MNRIDIVIPTRNRLAKLLRMLESVPMKAAGIDIRISIVCDGDSDTAMALVNLKSSGELSERISIILVPEHKGSIFCRNLEIAKCPDAVLPATDDIVFLQGSIDAAVKSMRSRFPNDDGIVGFTVHGANGRRQCRAGVALIGRKYLDRFPDRQLYYPGYFHFGAQELARGADRIGKLYLDPDARFIHYHPSRYDDEMDKTHVEGHLHRSTDRKLSHMREVEGKLWGIIA